jgi:hypothetical protein
VGIDHYAWAPLRGCVKDATDIADVLENDGRNVHEVNFEVKKMLAPLEGPHDIITKPVLKKAIETLFAVDCDICLFYFSGHGIITSAGGYIVTQDYQRYDAGISMNEIIILANSSKIKNKVILLDCCHSGNIGTHAGSNLAELSQGLVVITASREFEEAIEIDGKGLFTSLVVAALKGEAADLFGNVTAGNIYSYVDRAMTPWDQRPIFKANVTHFTPLRSIALSVPLDVLRRICNYFPDPQDEHPLDPSYDCKNEQKNPAKVAVMEDLQKFESAGLVVPVGAEHLYSAIVNSKSCRLTPLGYQYWRAVKAKMI